MDYDLRHRHQNTGPIRPKGPRDMETSTTHHIVESLTRAIVEHRLLPGTKLAEQKLADHFGVSRTLGAPSLVSAVAKPLDPAGARARRLCGHPFGRRSATGVCRAPHAGGGDDAGLCARRHARPQIKALREHMSNKSKRSLGGHKTTSSRVAPSCWATFMCAWPSSWATRCWPRCWAS
jgi:hypothetical protein